MVKRKRITIKKYIFFTYMLPRRTRTEEKNVNDVLIVKHAVKITPLLQLGPDDLIANETKRLIIVEIVGRELFMRSKP